MQSKLYLENYILRNEINEQRNVHANFKTSEAHRKMRNETQNKRRSYLRVKTQPTTDVTLYVRLLEMLINVSV